MVDIDKEKYKYLFEYMKEAFYEESDRYVRLEDKAIKYLSSITIFVTAFVLLLRWSLGELVPPRHCINYAVITSAIVTLASLSISWYYIFSSIKIQTVVKMPFEVEIIEMFKKHKRESVHLFLAKRYSEGTKKRSKAYSRKLSNVQAGYLWILISSGSFLIFISLLIVNKWLLN